MRLPLIAALLLACSTGALAAPTYHRVIGVAADDTLNVRAGPSASAEDIGDLPHDAVGIEVIETDESGDWGRIVWEEANGWIAMRFLADAPPATVGETQLPEGLFCAGTEPFWSLRLSAGGATFAGMDGSAQVMSMTGALTPQARGPFPVVVSHGGPTAASMAIIEPSLCSDGMSDRDYPWRILYILSTAEGQSLLDGCCQLPLEAGLH